MQRARVACCERFVICGRIDPPTTSMFAASIVEPLPVVPAYLFSPRSTVRPFSSTPEPCELITTRPLTTRWPPPATDRPGTAVGSRTMAPSPALTASMAATGAGLDLLVGVDPQHLDERRRDRAGHDGLDVVGAPAKGPRGGRGVESERGVGQVVVLGILDERRRRGRGGRVGLSLSLSMAAASAAASAAFWAWRWAAIRIPPSMTRPAIPSNAGRSKREHHQDLARPGSTGAGVTSSHDRILRQWAMGIVEDALQRLLAAEQGEHDRGPGRADRHADPGLDVVRSIDPLHLDGRLGQVQARQGGLDCGRDLVRGIAVARVGGRAPRRHLGGGHLAVDDGARTPWRAA